MDLSASQMALFLDGAITSSRSIKEEWLDIYGEESPQDAINDLAKIVSDMQDLTYSFIHNQEETMKMLRDYRRALEERLKMCEDKVVPIRVSTVSSLEDLGRILSTPRS